MRPHLLLLALAAPLLASCGWVERERQEAAEAARLETLAEVERVLAEAVGGADEVADAADRILSPMPVMTPAEEARLRRYLNASHVASAQRGGVRALNATAVEGFVGEGRLVALPDSTRFWIVREGTAPTWVVPQVLVLLETLGMRFQERLAALDLPAYRFEVTSALRTSERQAGLRGSNANAASGVSSHEFGTTIDLSYAAFAPPLETPDVLPAATPESLRPWLERIVDRSLESVSAQKSRELGKIFGDVLAEAQDEGLALVIYERQQTVYHVTVAGGAAASEREVVPTG